MDLGAFFLKKEKNDTRDTYRVPIEWRQQLLFIMATILYVFESSIRKGIKYNNSPKMLLQCMPKAFISWQLHRWESVAPFFQPSSSFSKDVIERCETNNFVYVNSHHELLAKCFQSHLAITKTCLVAFFFLLVLHPRWHIIIFIDIYTFYERIVFFFFLSSVAWCCLMSTATIKTIWLTVIGWL